MERFERYIASEGRSEPPGAEELDALVERYEWFALARRVRRILTGKQDRRLLLPLLARPVSPLQLDVPEPEELLRPSTDEIIDRFLSVGDYRIRAAEGDEEPLDGPDDSQEQAQDAQDDFASEELAQIYLSQGLLEDAKRIYRRLGLLYPEKSVYFAQIIARMECGPQSEENN